MNFGVQYYRPPFPVKKHWADDMKRIRDSGLDTVQLWVTWAWVESRSGQFRFDDYDRLVEMAHQSGLKVLLSTIAELQPHWIHREVPGSEMIDNFGHKIISSCREESNFGLTPGGCTENPRVWQRMAVFLENVVLRYRDIPHLVGWDAWNELRWHEQSDALVCFCPHCIRAFRQWLDARHGGLEGLNSAWKRRYSDWEEVMPGKLPWRTFTEMMAWQNFITWKANRHGKMRYDLIKALDPQREVTVHAGDPSPITSGSAQAYAIDRGNDWDYADHMDGVGCSSFPKLFGMEDTAFTTRIEYVRSAARGKKLWLSELQGGRGSMGFQPTAPVSAEEQQRWVWRGIAGGADKILFWCWRDEIFGREASGFGMSGNDGHAESRLKAMARTGNIAQRHLTLLDNYRPQQARTGVLFSPQTYYLHWSLNGHADEARNALEGCCRALTAGSIPYTVIEENHLEEIDSLDVLFLPRVLVTSSQTEAALTAFVKRGGTLVCEAECGAFTPEGIYRYPEERFLSREKLVCGREAGRRDLPPNRTIDVRMPNGQNLTLPAAQWLTPWQDLEAGDGVLAVHEDGGVLCEIRIPCNAATGAEELADTSQPFAYTVNAEACHASPVAAPGPHFQEQQSLSVRPQLRRQSPAAGSVVTLENQLPESHREHGTIILCGSYFSEAYYHNPSADYRHFIRYCCEVNQPQNTGIRVRANAAGSRSEHPVYIRTGTSDSHKLIFVFLPENTLSVELEIPPNYFNADTVTDILSGKTYSLNRCAKLSEHHLMHLQVQTNGIAVLTDQKSNA